MQCLNIFTESVAKNILLAVPERQNNKLDSWSVVHTRDLRLLPSVIKTALISDVSDYHLCKLYIWLSSEVVSALISYAAGMGFKFRSRCSSKTSCINGYLASQREDNQKWYFTTFTFSVTPGCIVVIFLYYIFFLQLTELFLFGVVFLYKVCRVKINKTKLSVSYVPSLHQPWSYPRITEL